MDIIRYMAQHSPLNHANHLSPEEKENLSNHNLPSNLDDNTKLVMSPTATIMSDHQHSNNTGNQGQQQQHSNHGASPSANQNPHNNNSYNSNSNTNNVVAMDIVNNSNYVDLNSFPGYVDRTQLSSNYGNGYADMSADDVFENSNVSEAGDLSLYSNLGDLSTGHDISNYSNLGDMSVGSHHGEYQLLDYCAPPRDKPIVHPATDPPLCEECRKMEMAFFDPNCPSCQYVLMNPVTTIPEIFAILRQWTPQTQQNLEILIREILKRGANVNDRDGLTDMTMLHYTVKAGAHGIGDEEEACRMTRLLIQKEADVFVRCRWTNMTALHYAVYFDVASVLTILLEASKGIDVDSQCSEFEHGTPLHIAAANMALESTRVLLTHKANPHVKDDLGRTPAECLPDASGFVPESGMTMTLVIIKKMLTETEYDESTNMSNSPLSDETVAAALHALGLRIGEKVMVGGVKSGILRYCGPTEFASGVWAGIELEEPAGKNDGSVSGIPYFRCSPKYGIFAPLSKITKPVPGALFKLPPPKPQTVTYGKVDVSKVTSRIDTGLSAGGGGGSVRGRGGQHLSLLGGPIEEQLEVGDRVIVAGQRRGVIQYSGDTDFAPGLWYGIELEKAVGKNDGSVNGRVYFTCKAKHGVFAPPSRVQKYIGDMYGSRESIESFTSFTERQRRLSGGSGSQQNMNTSTPTANKKSTPIRHGKYKLHSISESSGKRPKSSGTIGQMRRSLSSPTGQDQYTLKEGTGVFCNNELGVVRYLGPVDFAEGVWLGVELRTPKGKNDGTVQGKRYFTCKPHHGLIVRPSRVTVRGINGAKLLGDLENIDEGTSAGKMDLSLREHNTND